MHNVVCIMYNAVCNVVCTMYNVVCIMYNAVCNVVCTKVNAVCIDCFKFMMSLCINLWCFFWKVWWLIQGCCHFHTEIHCASATLHGSCWQLHMFSKLLTWYFQKPVTAQAPGSRKQTTLNNDFLFDFFNTDSKLRTWILERFNAANIGGVPWLLQWHAT